MNISRSIRRLSQLFIILFIALSGGLVYWQVVVAQQVTSNVHNIRHCLSDNAPKRGRIFDRNGVLLADSEPIDPHNPNKGNLCGYQRHYFLKGMPSLASLIGFYISPLFSSTGIEHEFDDYLTGRKDLTGLTNNFNEILHRPPVGDDIYLTIDMRIQKIAEHYFDADTPSYTNPEVHIDNVNIFPSNRGSIVITNPHTGEILAMVSRPTYDSNRVASGDIGYYNSLVRDPAQPLLERPLQARYVPGSTYKTMTLLAALDSNTTPLNDPIFDKEHAEGPVRIGGELFTPEESNILGYTHKFPVSMNYGFSHSDNIIFAGVGVKMGAQTWLDYNSRFYVGKQIPFDLPVATSSVTPQTGKFTDALLAENSFGQGVDFVTPMQMALINATIANNGQMMRPMLLQKIQAPDGTVIKSFSPQALSNPVSDTTASQARDAMYGVVRCGSGSIVPALYGSPWSIIAKTGTGEVGGGKPAQAWLISQAPYRNPQLSIVSMRENAGEGGSVNGPLAAHLYQDIFTQVMKLQQPQAPDPQEPYCFDQGLLN